MVNGIDPSSQLLYRREHLWNTLLIKFLWNIMEEQSH